MQALPGERQGWRAATALLVGLGIAAYLNGFAGVPQYDDYAVIVDEPRVASLAAWWASMPGIRPLLKLSYALNNSIGGLAGFHLVNLAIHLGNALLAWRVLLRLVPRQSTQAALLGALLFALHPVNGEAVMLLSGRSVSLAALGMLASLLCLLNARTMLSLVLFGAAVLVRETALVLPALATLCLAWIGWCAGRERALASALHACRWHWLLAGAAVLALLAMPKYLELLAFSLDARAPLDNLVTQAGATLWLLVQLLRPIASNSDPQLPVFGHWNAGWIAACTVWILALGWAIARMRRGSWLAFSLLWFAIALVPTNTVIARLDVANERQLYLAALPLYAGAGMIAGRARSYGFALASLLVLTLLTATILRNRDYRTESAFWNAVLERDANNARAWNNLGYALEHEQGDAAGAMKAYERAIALDPADYKPRHNRIALCARLPQQPGCAAR